MNKAACCILMILCIFWGRYSFATFTVTPGLNFREEYNDNIFLTESDEEEDYITIINPNINLKYSPNSKLDLDLDYGLNFRFYSRHDELNDKELSDTQYAEFTAHARPFNRFFIDITDTYKRIPIDVRLRTAEDNTFRNLNENNKFTISPYVILPLTNTLTTTIGYAYTNDWYKGKANVDSESHRGFISLDKKFTSLLSGVIRYNYYKYDPNSAGTSGDISEYVKHDASVGVTYQITPDINIYGEIGQAKLDYKSGEDSNVTFWNIRTDYKLRVTSGLSLGAAYGTNLHDSSTSGPFKGQRLDVFVNYNSGITAVINPYYAVNEFLRSDREDRITGVSVNVSRPLSSRTNISLAGNWQQHEFLPEDDMIHVYSIGSGLDYRLTQKITAAIFYRYNQRNSSVALDDFSNNIVQLSAKITF